MNIQDEPCRIVNNCLQVNYVSTSNSITEATYYHRTRIARDIPTHLSMTISSISWSEAFAGIFLPFACSLNANNILHGNFLEIVIKKAISNHPYN